MVKTHQGPRGNVVVETGYGLTTVTALDLMGNQVDQLIDTGNSPSLEAIKKVIEPTGVDSTLVAIALKADLYQAQHPH